MEQILDMVWFPLCRDGLFQEEHVAGALDFLDEFAMEFGGHAGDAAGKDAALFGHELFEQFGVLEVDRLAVDIDAALGCVARVAAPGAVILGINGHTFPYLLSIFILDG